MENSIKIYWELVFEMMSNALLIKHANPIREYEEELIDGAILDIGCGQSPFLLEYAASGRELIAIDNEELQLDFLEKRLTKISPDHSHKWSFLNQNFPADGIPDVDYALIVLSNILHFFTLAESKDIGHLVAQKSAEGTLIYVAVHSYKHYSNHPDDPSNLDYFKHYFTVTDLDEVFHNGLFEKIYVAEIEKSESKIEQELINKWLERSLAAEDITNPIDVNMRKADYVQNKMESDIIAIFRRR